MLFGTLACASSMARPEDTEAARDTSEAQNPPDYRGMERDTTQVSTDSQPTASDTFLQEQGTGVPEDTAGYSGLEHPDTSADGAGYQWSGYDRHGRYRRGGHLRHVRLERYCRTDQLGFDRAAVAGPPGGGIIDPVTENA